MAFQATERIYVNHAHTEIVPEDYPDGAVLLVPEGGYLTDEDAAAWGLAGSKSDKASVDASPPSPEQAAANAQRIGADERDTAASKAQKGSKNKAQAAPEVDKAADGTVFSEASFSAGQPQNAVSSADASAPDIQPLPQAE